MNPIDLTPVTNVIIDAVRQVFPYLATGISVYWVVRLHQRNEREKDELKRSELETTRQQADVDAQSLINRRYDEALQRANEANDRANEAKTQVVLTRAEFAEEKLKFAEERGGLKQQIADLIDQQRQERQESDTKQQNNDRAIGDLQNQINQLLEKQRLLEESVLRTSTERDELIGQLQGKVDELIKAQEQLSHAQILVDTLNAQVDDLKKLVEEKEQALDDLRKQLDSPRKRRTQVKESNNDSA